MSNKDSLVGLDDSGDIINHDFKRGNKKTIMPNKERKRTEANDSISLNSIDVSIDRKKKKSLKQQDDLSFDFKGKVKPKDYSNSHGNHGNKENKSSLNDSQLSKIEELQKLHDSIMEEHRRDTEKDSSIISEHKDNVQDLIYSQKPHTPNLEPQKTKSDINMFVPDRPNSSNLLAAPKTGMIRSQSLVQIEEKRAATANSENRHQDMDGQSVAGSMRSYMSQAKSNFHLLRVSPKLPSSKIPKQVLQVLQR